MRFKLKYKSCLWNRTDIWGDLHTKKHTFLRPKWDAIIGIAVSKTYRKSRSCHMYKFVTPKKRPNSVFDCPRWGYRSFLSSRFCLQRFYGDIKYKYLRKLCKPLPASKVYHSLEGRLDRVLTRLGVFKSILLSRQCIRHRKVLVNNSIISYGNYVLKKGDLIEIRPKFKPFVFSHMRTFVRPKKRSVFGIRRKGPNNYTLCPTPDWVHTDYKYLRFMITDNLNYSSGFHPFRIKYDDLTWMTKCTY